MQEAYTVYGKPNCQGCDVVKSLLLQNNLTFTYVDVMIDLEARKLFQKYGWRSVPQVFQGGFYIGGQGELQVHLNALKAISSN